MRPCVVVLLVLTSMFLLSCGGSGSTSLRIGIIKPSIDHLPLSVAIDQKYLDSGTLRIVNFTSGWEVQEAITAGKIDLAIMPFTYAWTAISKGYKIKIVSCLERETDGLVSLPQFKSVRDLDKRRIGLLRASTLEILMQDTARQNGIHYKPVFFRTPVEMIAALKAREVDAIVCYVPLIQKMGTDYTVLHWFSELYPAHPCCDLVATEHALTKHHKAVQNLRTGLNRAINDINNPSEHVFKLMENLYGLNDLQGVEALRHTKFDSALTEEDKQFEQQMMESFLTNGYVKLLPPIDNVYSR